MSASLFKYRDAFYKSQKLFNYLKLDSFPVDMFEIFQKAKRFPILVVSLKEYNRDHIPLKIKDAKCFYYPEKAYLIVYNEQKPDVRIRFSLAHELGHIILGHLNDKRTEIERGGLDDVTYYILEGAANTFAGNFLAPPILIHKKLSGNSFYAEEIASLFGLSSEAVQDYRYPDYIEWLTIRKDPCEMLILDRCYEHLFPNYCQRCGSLFYGSDVKYCPVCGSKNIAYCKGGADFMKTYPGVPTNENKKVLTCPCCGNEEFETEGDYCPICGTFLFNHCVDTIKTDDGINHSQEACEQGKILPSNYRFCPYCGNETYFYQMGFLKNWDSSKTQDFEIIPDDAGLLF